MLDTNNLSTQTIPKPVVEIHSRRTSLESAPATEPTEESNSSVSNGSNTIKRSRRNNHHSETRSEEGSVALKRKRNFDPKLNESLNKLLVEKQWQRTEFVTAASTLEGMHTYKNGIQLLRWFDHHSKKPKVKT